MKLEAALKKADAPDTVFLVDCLTLWLSNWCWGPNWTMNRLASGGEALAELLPNLQARVILVANEVGLGIVPENALARRWRDLAGSLSQRLARSCDAVLLITAGLPLALKGGPLPLD